ncbi:PDZ domain-containing protein, partial [Nocardioides sp.]|uniref:YlbL family protein n=1 Tax=Nocardioides sp. TaxID=35761 RepID=UPI003567087B
SQDNAVAAALRELGYDVEPALQVLSIGEGTPADGALAVRDIFVSVDGVALTPDADGQKTLLDAIKGAEDGQQLTFVVLRDGQRETVKVGTRELVDDDGSARRQIGITLGFGFIFPFTVAVNISDNIGGPSAGLVFSLAIYDTLTPGSLTGGKEVAGTGELDSEGNVGPIGGIEQKIAGARDSGADLFLVPAANCADALSADAGDMRLLRAETMPQTLAAVEAWVADPKTDLPSCEDAA